MAVADHRSVKGKPSVSIYHQSLISMYLHIRFHSAVTIDRSNTMCERAADLFGLLASPMRLRVVFSLIDGERNVSDLAESLAASQPSMSQHLGTLYRGGVLARRRTGAQIFYRIENEQARRDGGRLHEGLRSRSQCGVVPAGLRAQQQRQAARRHADLLPPAERTGQAARRKA